MKKSVVFLFIAILVSMLSGCIITVTPKETTVIIAPDEIKTFIISVFPWDATYEWQMDGEVLTDETSGSFIYQYANDGEIDHVLSVKAKHPNGTEETYQWNLYVATASQVIGSQGGKLEVTDTSSELYGTSIDIPQGALQGDTLVSFNALDVHPKLPEDMCLAGPVILVSLKGLQNTLSPSQLNMKLGDTTSTFNMTLPYWDSNKDGIVDHTGQPVDNLVFKVYDGNLNELPPLTIKDINRNYGTVTSDLTISGDPLILVPTAPKGSSGKNVFVFTIDGLSFFRTGLGEFGLNKWSLRPEYLRNAILTMVDGLGLWQGDIYSYGEEMDSSGSSWNGDATQTPKVVDGLREVLRSQYDKARAENKKFILVTHSWGAVLAKLALEYNQAGNNPIEPDLIITLSSPLGSNNIHSFDKDYYLDFVCRVYARLINTDSLLDPFNIKAKYDPLYKYFKDVTNPDVKVSEVQGKIEKFTSEQTQDTYDHITNTQHSDFRFIKWVNYWDNGDAISGPLPDGLLDRGDFENRSIDKYDSRTLRSTCYTHALTSMSSDYWNDPFLKVLIDTVPIKEGFAFRGQVEDLLSQYIGHTITGRVTASGGAGLSGVTVTCTDSGASTNSTTDPNGYYAFNNVADSAYTLSFSKTGYTFSPETVSVVVYVNNISAVPMVVASQSGIPTSYTITDLGTPNNLDGYATPHDINNNGQMVGDFYNTSTKKRHAFLYSNGTFIDIGALLGDDLDSYANGINNNGQVVGYYWSSDGTQSQSHAFLYNNGAVSDLYIPDAYLSQAAKINDSGQIIGNYNISSGASEAFLYSNGVATKFTWKNYMRPLDINNSGQVTGIYGSNTLSFLYSNGTFIDIGTLGGYSVANAINDNGQIAGYSNSSIDGLAHAFLYDNGVMTDLGTLNNYDMITQDINNQGQIVGYYVGNNGYGFIYTNGALYDLLSLIDSNSGWTSILGNPLAINDYGQITGQGVYNHKVRAILMTPVYNK